MKFYFYLYCIQFLFLIAPIQSQAQQMPIKIWQGNSSLPLVIYISGDGGFNKFSNNLCAAISAKGYQVIALDAKSYFWNKKTPGQAATGLEKEIKNASTNNESRKIIFTGYSFGADVLPFIYNQFPENMKTRIRSVIMISPSGSTDFEIHLSDMLGGNTKREMDVFKEVNNMGIPTTVVINGDDEKDTGAGLVTRKNFHHETIPGGHHFEGDINTLASVMMKYF
ncbi:MAG: virulence factor family protein [Bacteroidetes bacterium]|nr:virulence factor family protein [Bacteroidota bacterium]